MTNEEARLQLHDIKCHLDVSDDDKWGQALTLGMAALRPTDRAAKIERVRAALVAADPNGVCKNRLLDRLAAAAVDALEGM